MFKKIWQDNKARIIHELGLWISIFLGFIATQGHEILTQIYLGDYSYETLKALKILVFTSLISSILIRIFPNLFPLYRKDEGILPPKNN